MSHCVGPLLGKAVTDANAAAITSGLDACEAFLSKIEKDGVERLVDCVSRK